MAVKKKRIKKYSPKEDDQKRSKNYSFIKDDITYKLMAIGYDKPNELRPWYSDLHVDWYIGKLNFVDAFNITESNENPAIDKIFYNMKKRLEKFFPDSIIIFQYPTKFVLRKNTSEQEPSGVKISLCINLKKEFELKKGSLLMQHSTYTNLIIDSVNQEVMNLFK